MRARWNALNRQTQAVIGLAVAFVLFRTIIASLSGFGFHQGWNEGHYALLGSGFLDHPLVPRYGDRFVYSVPPLFQYTISVSFLLFGESVLAARLPSILATGGLIYCTYELGREVFEDRQTAVVGAVILATLPYVQLYGGRAQTDIMMVFFVTAAVSSILKGYRRETGWQYWLVSGAALFAAAVATKQPALGAAGIILFWLLGNQNFNKTAFKRTVLLIVGSIICLLPLLIWMYFNYQLAPVAFVTSWEHELFGRTSAFANIQLVILVGLIVGMTPLVLASSAIDVITELRDTVVQYRTSQSNEPGPSVLVWWLVLFGLFVFARSPQGHQYYAIVLAPPLALLAASGFRTIAHELHRRSRYEQNELYVMVICIALLTTLSGTVVLFELSGEFSVANGGGTQVASDASNFVIEEIPEDATLLVANGYAPPVKWYLRHDRPVDQILSYHPSSLDKQRIQSISADTDGSVYLIAPSPSWGYSSSIETEQIYSTPQYESTVMSTIGKYIKTESKFTYYTNNRQINIYDITKLNR